MRPIITTLLCVLFVQTSFAVEERESLGLLNVQNSTASITSPKTAIFSQSTPATNIIVEDKLFNVSNRSSFLDKESGKVEVTLKLIRPGKHYNAQPGNAFEYNLPLKIEVWKDPSSSILNGGYRVFYTTLSLHYTEANENNSNQLMASFTTENSNYYKVKVSQDINAGGPNLTYNDLDINDVEIELNAYVITNRTYKVDIVTANAKYQYLGHGNGASYNGSEGNVGRIEINNLFGGTPVSLTNADEIVPEEYDLEWSFIDFSDELVTTYNITNVSNINTFNHSIPVSVLDKLHYSRVTLTKQNRVFDIPLVYNKGYIIYRVRPTNYNSLGERNEKEPWSYQNVKNGTTTKNIFYVAPHEESLNWTSSISFAEDGKRKASVSYFDGTQRERQSSTINTTSNVTLISESFYDFEGRKAIATLPAPYLKNTQGTVLVGNFPNTTTFTYDKSTPANSLKFYQKFSLKEGDVTFKEEHYNEEPENGCLPIISSPLSKNTGASQYYSGQNFLHNNATLDNKLRYLNYWLPKANQYPYIQTKYTDDGTNKVKVQSGVGDAHKLASGHESKYFYINCSSQDELDRLFGTEVGQSQFYSKTFSIDPNGQTSVTYKDMKDRTIATALIGDKPQNLEPLDSDVPGNTSDYVGINPISYDFITENNLVRDYSKLLLYGSATHYVPVDNENMDFTLDFTTAGYDQDLCLPTTGCVDCYYDIEVHMTDNCGNSALQDEHGNIVESIELSNYDDPPVFDFTCNNDNPSPRPNVSKDFTLSGMDKGAYQISANVKVPEEYADHYTREYMEEMEDCDLYDLQKMIEDNIKAIDPFSCITSCKQCNELKDKGYVSYKARVEGQLEKVKDKLSITKFNELVENTAQEQWAKLADRCKDFCDGAYYTECLSYKQTMLSDVGRNGQYGFTIDASGKREVKNGEVSVLYAIIDNSDFLKADGITRYYSLSDVLEDWKDEWREILLKYHPEYCYYEKCIQNQQANINIKKALELQKKNGYSCTPFIYGMLNGTYIDFNDFMSEHDNFKFFSINPNATSRNLKEWAFLMAFGKYMEPIDMTNQSSSTKPYTINHFSTSNQCLTNDYCDQDKALYWHHYMLLIQNLIDYYKNEGYRPNTTHTSNIQLSTPETACYPNEYISCNNGNTGTDDTHIDNSLSSYGDLFDNIFSSDPNSSDCDLYGTNEIMNFNTSTSNTISFDGEDFNDKERVFPDYQTFMDGFVDKISTLASSGGTTTVQNNIDEDAKKAMCEKQSEGWLLVFKKCILNKIPLNGLSKENLAKEIKANLVEVCKEHCGEEGYYFGTKSISKDRTALTITVFEGTGSEATYNDIRSFQDVIDKYAGSIVDPTCNADLISLPEYGVSPSDIQEFQYEYFAKEKESCECDQIQMWKDKYIDEGGSLSFYQYMKDHDASFNITPDELQQLEDGCADENPKCRFFAKPIQLPNAFQCKKSLNCFEIALLKDGFKRKYDGYNWGGDPKASTVYQDALAGYYNSYKGMNLTYYDYKMFEDECEDCVESDFVEMRSGYQQIYNEIVNEYKATNTTANQYTSWKKDNLKALATGFTAKGVTINNQAEMIKLLCDYLIDTDDEIPCCVSKYYYEFINKYPIKPNQSEYRYNEFLKSYINARGKYRLSLNDYTAILANCGDIILKNEYNCCDLNLKWKEYDQLVGDNMVDPNELSREEYLNHVLGQNKSGGQYDKEMQGCGDNGDYGFINCKTIESVACPPEFDVVLTAYKGFLKTDPMGSTFEIDWNNISPYFISKIDIQTSFPVTASYFKTLFYHPKCDKKDCDIINHYITRFEVNHGVTLSSMSPSKYGELIDYLAEKTLVGKGYINGLVINCNRDKCSDYQPIYQTHYKNYLAANPSFEMDWENIPQNLLDYLNTPAVGLNFTITADDLKYLMNNMRSCIIPNECAELQYMFDRFMTLKGYGTYLPPSETDNLLAYLSKFMSKNISIKHLEDCDIIDFCEMYEDIYDAYLDYLHSDISFIMNWNAIASDVLNHIYGETNHTVSPEDLKAIYTHFKRCYMTECDEVSFYFNRFLQFKQIVIQDLKVTDVSELISYLNSFMDLQEDHIYWTEKLDKCADINLCELFYTKIFNAFIQFHKDNPDFEIVWDGAPDQGFIDHISQVTGFENLTYNEIFDAFNNNYCHDKYHCYLIKHYFYVYQNLNQELISNPQSSLTGLVRFLNQKFMSELTFKEWLKKLRDCDNTNIEDYIPKCKDMRQCLIDLLIEYETIEKPNILNFDALIASQHHDFLNNCIGKGYIIDDWKLLFSLCEFNDKCFDLEVFMGRIEKKTTANVYDCNIQTFYEEYHMYTSGLPSDYDQNQYHCFDVYMFNRCNLDMPFGFKFENLESLVKDIKVFICSTAVEPTVQFDPQTGQDVILPSLYFDPATNVFKKGHYLEALRDHLNTLYGVTLSICDYEFLLENYQPCCYGDFFENLNYEFIRDIRDPSLTIYGGPQGTAGGHSGTTRFKYDDYNCNATNMQFTDKLPCSKFYDKRRIVPSTGALYTWLYNGKSTPDELNGYAWWRTSLFTQNSNVDLSVFSTDDLSYLTPDLQRGIYEVNYWDKSCRNCPPKSDTDGESDFPCGTKIPCSELVPAYNTAETDADDLALDKTADFDFWWEMVYWQMTYDLFDHHGYVSKEEMKIMLLCCGVDIRDLDCNELQTLLAWLELHIGDLSGDYPEATTEKELIQAYFNDKFGVDETYGYWKAKAEEHCNLSFLTDNDYSCEDLVEYYTSDFSQHYNWFYRNSFADNKGFGIYSAKSIDRIKLMKQCLTCEEIFNYFTTNGGFREELLGYYENATGNYRGFGQFDVNAAIAYFADYFDCEWSSEQIGIMIAWSGGANQNVETEMAPPIAMEMMNYSEPNEPNESIAYYGEISQAQTTSPSSSSQESVPEYSAAPPIYQSEAPLQEGGEAPPASEQEPMGMEAYEGDPSSNEQYNFYFGIDVDDFECCNVCDKRIYDRTIVSSVENEDPCQYTLDLATTNAIEERETIMKQLAIDFKKKYIQKCMDNAHLTLSADANDQEHHYTLYYYGQDGNLIQTVPPAGVKKFTTAADFTAVANARNTGGYHAPAHTMATKYWYNMANQVVKQKTPDAGESVYVYDELGRLILSQSAKQYPSRCSYTIYDKFNRIVESGEVNSSDYNTFNIFTGNSSYFEPSGEANGYNIHYMNNCNYEKLRTYKFSNYKHKNVVRTFYDRMEADVMPPNATFIQENLNKRIAVVTLDEDDDDRDPSTFNSAMYYSYDILGNVANYKTYVDNSLLPPLERLKDYNYEYDLQSGKVNKVYYQKGKSDQYIHKYEYDAENRLVAAKTSFDDYFFNTEATYSYYLHGPLARTQMGENLVQGLDYIYTIHGWLKSVNGSQLNIFNELGQDGIHDGNGQPFPPQNQLAPVTALNKNVARDAVSFSLGYYHDNMYNDFEPIHNVGSNIYNGTIARSLYNGNIPENITSQFKFNSSNTPASPSTMMYQYQYDQLNRIVKMDALIGPMNNFTATTDYQTAYKYDPNGNLLSLSRNRDLDPSMTSNEMDDLQYAYYHRDINTGQVTTTPSATTEPINQLAQVIDAVSNNNAYDKDIDNIQTASDNYVYDNIGNLIEDKSEQMNIAWTPAGKIDYIIDKKDNQCLEFEYDPMGNRVMKSVYKSTTCTGTPTYTYYLRDAQGNLITTYTNKAANSESGQNYRLSEYYIYGSSRLGVKTPKLATYDHGTLFVNPNDPISDNPLDVEIWFNSSTNSSTNTNYSVDRYREPCYICLWEPNSLGLRTVAKITKQYSGMSQYEIPNHLGNVLATVKDEPTYDFIAGQVMGGQQMTPNFYPIKPIVMTATDYYPFGMTMPGRSYTATGLSSYRFGFNTQEKDDEIYGAGNMTTAKYWQYDARIGRRWNLDPVFKEHESPYLVNSGNPIVNLDPLGDDDFIAHTTINKTLDDDGNLVSASSNTTYSVVKTKDKNRYINRTSSYENGKFQATSDEQLKYKKAAIFMANNWNNFSPSYTNQQFLSDGSDPTVEERNFNDAVGTLRAGQVYLAEQKAAELFTELAGYVLPFLKTTKATKLFVPKGFISKPTKKNGGVLFYNPQNTNQSIRFMKANPNSVHLEQRRPYVIFQKDGRFYNVNGQITTSKKDRHIPMNEFDITKMPKF